MLSTAELAEQVLREIQAYRCGDASVDVYSLELLRRAIVQGDQEAWAFLQPCLVELVQSWLRSHPSYEVAARLDSEEHYVELAFECFRQAIPLAQAVEFRTLAAALRCLRASLNGVILDRLRASSRPAEVLLPGPGEPEAQDKTDGCKVWEILKALLPDEREQRLAYLLFHCGLKPVEVARFSPQEFGDIRDITRLRRQIMEQLLRKTGQLCWQFSVHEQQESRKAVLHSGGGVVGKPVQREPR